MDDPTLAADRAPDAICPWCSASLAIDAVTCPSCGANLTSDEEHDLPGVTEVDATLVRGEKPRASRSRLLAWLSGEYPESSPSEAEAQALAPPDPDVQREMLRLELEAQVATLQAEANANLSDALIEGRVVDVPGGLQPVPPESADETVPASAASPDGAPSADVEAPTDGDAPAGVTPA